MASGSTIFRPLIGLLLSAVAAAASDRPATDWSGFYVGGHLGYGRGQATPWLSGLPAQPGTVGFGSLYGGVQAGYNHQVSGGWVAGIEVDLSFPDAHPLNDVVWSGVVAPGLVTETVDYLGTARARFGYAQDDWLLFVTGGLAWSSSHATRVSAPGADDDIARARLRAGWVVGGGVALALAYPWSLRAEYLHHRLGRAEATFPGGPSYRSDIDIDVWRLGLDYRFGEPSKPPARHAEDFPVWEVHGQSTVIVQGYPRFRSPYVGAGSLTPWPQAKSTFTASAFFGVRLWDGGELYFNPELLQGYGFNGTTGAGGFPNGEAQKSDFLYPHYNTSRFFLRQTFGLGGAQETVESDYGQMAGKRDVSRLTVQIGKFAVHDWFDTNAYATDPRIDFLNWSIWAAGAFDYPADRLGLTYGAAAELNQAAFALRAGYFLVGKVPNGSDFDMALFRRGGYVAELERRYALLSMPGKIRLTGWLHETFSGGYRDALDLVAVTPALDINDAIVQSRRGRAKYGYVVNVEQAVGDDLGLFTRWSWNNGRNEISAFTDIDMSLSGGLVIKGTSWGRADDKIGLAGAINGLSRDHRDYLAAGGLGILVGDGRLSYATERIVETFYAAKLAEGVTATADYQLIVNPGYNRDRGPVSVFTARLHWER